MRSEAASLIDTAALPLSTTPQDRPMEEKKKIHAHLFFFLFFRSDSSFSEKEDNDVTAPPHGSGK